MLNSRNRFDEIEDLMQAIRMNLQQLESAELLYGDIEIALIRTLGIKLERIDAFRARLRHMRNLGVPSVPKVGSGRKIMFSYSQALEMLITVALEHGGYTPRVAVVAGPGIVRMYADQAKKIEGDIWVAVPPAEADNPVCAFGSHEQLHEMEKLKTLPPLYFRMNLSRLIRQFEWALVKKASDVTTI
jgi:hypothetical protein